VESEINMSRRTMYKIIFDHKHFFYRNWRDN